MTTTPFIVETKIVPRYAETDAQGVIYHANYIVWFEVARGEYCIAIGYPYARIEQEGINFMVTEMSAKYYSPVRYADEVIVKVWLEKIGRASCHYAYQVYNQTQNKICVEGYSKHAAVSPEGKIVAFSRTLYDLGHERAGRGPSQYVPQIGK